MRYRWVCLLFAVVGVLFSQEATTVAGEERNSSLENVVAVEAGEQSASAQIGAESVEPENEGVPSVSSKEVHPVVSSTEPQATPVPVGVSDVNQVSGVAVAEKPRERKGGGAGGVVLGLSLNNMRSVKKLLDNASSDLDSVVDFDYFNSRIDEYQVMPVWGAQGYYQTNAGFRVGGSMKMNSFYLIADALNDSSMSVYMFYANVYFGALVGGSFGNESHHANVSVALGGGGTNIGFTLFEEDYWDAENIAYVLQPFFSTEVTAGYIYSFGQKKLFHLGFDMGGVLQAARGRTYVDVDDDYDQNPNYHDLNLPSSTVFNTHWGIRFIVGRKS